MFEDLGDTILIAVIQGITEFLPVSSSGHILIFQKLLHSEPSVVFSIVLHAGSLLAIVAVYFRELFALLKQNRALVPKLFAGTLPIAVAGLALHLLRLDEILFENLAVAGAGLLVTSFLLSYGMKKTSQKIRLEKLSFADAVRIGLFQALALVPGISRSGSTISCALSRGVKREDAATFSFLLAVPAIFGASLMAVWDLLYLKTAQIGQNSILSLAVGFAVSAIVGYVALNTLLRSLRKGNLRIYAFYCLAIGIIVLLWVGSGQ